MMPAMLRTLVSLFILCAVSLMSGCGGYSFLRAASRQPPLPLDQYSVLVVPAPSLESGDAYQKKVNDFALMAWFANLAYRKDLDESARSGKGCDYSASALNGMPVGGRWRRLLLQAKRPYSGEDVTSCFDQKGLYYETYFHENIKHNNTQVDTKDDEYDYAVIAIRGTENYSRSEFLRDWSSDFEAALGRDPTEYRYARERLKPLIDHLTETYPKIEIYVTGHSLGGGIAQQIAYMSNQVKAAYVFNSSPATNWSQMMLMHPMPITNQNPEIHRIFHRHEALASIRDLATRLTTTRLNREDVEFFYKEDTAAESHSMAILACNFSFRTNEAAAFDFPHSQVVGMLTDHRFCPEGSIVVIPRKNQALTGNDVARQ